VNAELLGVFMTVGQTIEDRDGKPLAVDHDILGRPFDKRYPGPLAQPKAGANSIRWRDVRAAVADQ
jgi:hypothetical protein